MTEKSPAITESHPPAAVLRVMNPIMRALLRTPLMGGARKQLMVVTFTGRKTGRQYSIPLSAHLIDDTLFALTDAPWKRNFRGGTTAQVLHDGKTTTMRGELIEEPGVVADLYHRCAQSYSAKQAQRALGMKFRDNQVPSLDDFAEAVNRLNLVAIRFTA